MATSYVLDQPRATTLGSGLALLALCLLGIVVSTPYAIYVNYLYPTAALALGAWFYLTNPGLYFGYTWWLWFLTPLVRRYVDYEVGFFNQGSYIMLAPMLVTGLSLFTLLRSVRQFRSSFYQPMALVLGALAYGYAVGIFRNGPFPATLSLLEWACPVLFAVHVLVNHRHYPTFRRVTRSVFTWGILIMGLYGIAQYFSPLPWDRFWMIESKMTTIGRPEPFEVRIFSTLNSPGPFAGILMVGLMVLFEARGITARLSMASGFVSFLLSLVRSAWGGFAVSLSYAILRLQSRLRLRLLVVLGVGILFALPLLMHQSVSTRVSSRVESLGSLGNDNSFRARSGLYSIAAVNSLTEPVGRGFGSFGRAANYNAEAIASFDSGIMIVPFTFGWLGSALYGFGFLWLVALLLRLRQTDTDEFTIVAAAVVMGMIAQMIFSNQFSGVVGMVTWTFTALAICGGQYARTARPRAADVPDTTATDSRIPAPVA
jgi:hypothetical protein